MSPTWVNNMLRDVQAAARFEHLVITSHSMRIGRVCDLALKGASLKSIRLAWRWRSDAFRNYIRLDSVNI